MWNKAVLLLLVPCLQGLPQQSYLAPLEDREVSASSVISSYGSPGEDILGEASEAVSLYSSPSEVVSDYSSPQGEIIFSPSNEVSDYSSPQGNIISSPSNVVSDYSSPQGNIISSPSNVVSDYSSPQGKIISSPDYSEIIFSPSSVSQDYNSLSSYGVSDDEDTASSNVARVEVRAEPIAIVRSEYTGPNDGNYHYAYETANGITQDVTGEMRVVDDAQVYVMRGSYSYTGDDGLPYVVDWYADETGYHPSAPHLPKSVQPVTDQVRQAVEQQLRFAAQEDAAAAAASANNVVYAAPDEVVGGESVVNDVYAAADDNLAGYGQDASATRLLDSYSLPSYN